MIDVNRWVLELRSLVQCRGYHRCCIKVEEILHKLIGMLGLHSVGGEYVCGKVPLVEGYDHAGTAADGRSQNMTVVGIR